METALHTTPGTVLTDQSEVRQWLCTNALYVHAQIKPNQIPWL